MIEHAGSKLTTAATATVIVKKQTNGKSFCTNTESPAPTQKWIKGSKHVNTPTKLRHVEKHASTEGMQIKIPGCHAPTTLTKVNQDPNV